VSQRHRPAHDPREESLRDYKGHSWPECVGALRGAAGRRAARRLLALEYYDRAIAGVRARAGRRSGNSRRAWRASRRPDPVSRRTAGHADHARDGSARLKLLERFGGPHLQLAGPSRAPSRFPDLYLHAAARAWARRPEPLRGDRGQPRAASQAAIAAGEWRRSATPPSEDAKRARRRRARGCFREMPRTARAARLRRRSDSELPHALAVEDDLVLPGRAFARHDFVATGDGCARRTR